MDSLSNLLLVNSNNTYQTSIRELTPSQIDDEISNELDRLTLEDSDIWNAPNYDRRDFVHSFFQYPAMMVPIVQKRLIESIVKYKPSTSELLDPFMGSSTSIIAGMQCGLNCTGQDINPLAVLLSKVKCGPYYHNAFKLKSENLIERVSTDKSNRIIISYTNWRKWFRNDVAIELSKLVRSIRQEELLSARRLFWITLAEVIRLTSNDRTSTFKLHARPINVIESRFISPIEMFKKLISKNIEDIKKHRDLLQSRDLLSKGSYKKNIHLLLRDSSESIYTSKTDGKKNRYDLLVSSSPYGDNQTTVSYGQHAFLALHWIDFKDIDPKADDTCLSTSLEIDNRSMGGNRAKFLKGEKDRLFVKSLTLKRIITQLEIDHKDKTKKVIKFVYDFDRSLDKILNILKPNSYLIWTMGNRHVGGIEIENDNILIELMTNKNCHLVTRLEREILNKRMAKNNCNSKTMNSEDILIFRKVG